VMNSRAEINIARAGEFFIYCLWIQGQMADLIIFKKYPGLIEPFVSSPNRIPAEMVDLRSQYWEKGFVRIKEEFEQLFFNQIGDKHKNDLGAIYYLRNAIAHSHVSIGRDYFLYRPGRGEEHQAKIVSALELEPVENPSAPQMMTMRFFDDQRYLKDFNRIKRLDEECFSEIARSLSVPHGRIR
jgi:hypothetical protein